MTGQFGQLMYSKSRPFGLYQFSFLGYVVGINSKAPLGKCLGWTWSELGRADWPTIALLGPQVESFQVKDSLSFLE